MENCHSQKPKPCQICERASFLVCCGCSTTYCSTDCQIQDWFSHQNRHTKAQNDLKMELDEITTRMEDIDVNYSSGLIEIQSFFDRPIASIKKFRRPAMIPNNAKDENGYFHVVITSIDLADLENIVYSVNLASFKNELTVYKTLLNMTYDNDQIIPLLNSPLDYSKQSKSLMMIKIGSQWTRCVELLVFDNMILFEDIDTGKKHRLNAGLSFKMPQKQELARNAFAFKVKFNNIFDRSAVDVGDIVKVNIQSPNLRGVSDAEIEIVTEEPMDSEEFEVNTDEMQDLKVIFEKPKFVEERQVIDISEDEKRTAGDNKENSLEWNVDSKEFVPKKKPAYPRIFISQLKIKNLPLGRQTLTYLDSSKLKLGKIQVCLTTDEHLKFYNQLFKDIEEYVDKNEDKSGYQPELGELVLAEFDHDGGIYRAVCISVSKIDCKVAYIDYGSDSNVEFEKVWKLPQQFAMPCISRSVVVKLKSGKELKDIDVPASMDMFEQIDKFEADVEFLGGSKFSITIDDSLVAFQ